MEPGSIPTWAQLGGMGLFALAVWWQLRDLAPRIDRQTEDNAKRLESLRQENARMAETMAALLEHQRERDRERKRSESAHPESLKKFARPPTEGR